MRVMRIIASGFVVVVLLLSTAPQRAVAQGVYLSCTFGWLVDAIEDANSGDTITLDCPVDTSITFEHIITIQKTVIIEGVTDEGQVTFDGNNSKAFFKVDNDGGDLTLKNLTLTNGGGQSLQGTPVGGAIWIVAGAYQTPAGRLTVERSTFSGNDSVWGGTIYNGGSTTITRSTFIDNTGTHGGVILQASGSLNVYQSRFEGNYTRGDGGAIAQYGGSMTVAQSSFVDNRAYRFGGAIHIDDGSSDVVSSTFTGNTAGNSGSAFFISSGVSLGAAHIYLSTIVQPESTKSAIYMAGILQFTGVILGGNGVHCKFASGGLLVVQYSLSNDTVCNFSDPNSGQGITLGLAPQVTKVIDGVEQTFYPLITHSFAVDGGPVDCDPDISGVANVDQIGTQRPVGDSCDIGAIEDNNSAPTVSAGGAYIGNENVAIPITGVVADIDQDPLTYQWSWSEVADVDPGATCAIADPTALSTTITCDDEGHYGLRLSVGDGMNEIVSSSTPLTVVNSAPEIKNVDANPQVGLNGQPVTFTVDATDVPFDTLTSSVNCGGGEAIGLMSCVYHSAGYYHPTITVDDGDGGKAMQSVEILQIDEYFQMCANNWNGSLHKSADADCDRSETLITLPQPNLEPITLCVSEWNGSTRFDDQCSRSEYSVSVTGLGDVGICVNRWNGYIRVSDRCSRSEYADSL